MKSKGNLPVRFTEDAERDVWSILQYSLESWGQKQSDRYQQKLEKGFQTLSENPRIGREKENGFLGCRCFQVEQHIIFYKIDSNSVTVIRILHERMDVPNRL